MKGSFDLKKIGGLYKYFPLIGLLFLIPALSLAGIPPLSGFWAKFVVIKAGLEIEQVLIVVVALVVGLLTLFSMIKIWNEAFWKDDPRGNEINIIDSFSSMTLSRKVLMFSPIVILALITIIIGFNSEPFFNFANDAASQLLNPNEYISKVLGL
jgi:multicomponent Na+:H+ antiporter subunit D